MKRGFQRLIFIKQESLVLGDLTPLFEILEQASIVLTPHLVAPLAGADRIERELNILQSGTFNVGMLGVAATPVAARFLEWWQDRVYAHCRHAIASGMHYEQRWLDLVPALFGDVHVLRDPAYNVGHWNLPDRAVTVDGDQVLVNGEPCRLFRFSGYDFERPGGRHQVLAPVDARERRTGATRLRALSRRAGTPRLSRDEGRGLMHTARSTTACPCPMSPARCSPRWATTPTASAIRCARARAVIYEWLNQAVEGEPNRPGTVTRLWHAVYRARPDLQIAFPDVSWGRSRGISRAGRLSPGCREHDVSDHFLVSPATGG